MGLKENVIIGKLIPTGTGLRRYQDIKINTEVEQTVEDMVIPEASEEVKQEENK